MPYNTKDLKEDLSNKKIPQFFDVAADDYYALLGTSGAGPHYVNVDTSGDELFVAGNPGIVSLGAAMETVVTAIKTAVEGTLTVDVDSSALPTGAATEDKQDTGNTALTAIKDTDGIKKITDALPAGTNLLGKVGIDQTTDGTTNKVHVGNTVDVQVTGSTVVIDGTTYQLTDGAVLRGTNAIKPTAALAHAAIPYCYYFAIDTGVVEATDGTNWVVI